MSDYLERVRAACLNRCPAILYDWLPGGHAVGKTYQCASSSGGQGDSLKVNLLKGLWKDWSTDQPGGDLISLYAAAKSLTYKDALRDLAAQFEIQPDSRKTRTKASWQAVLPIPEPAVPKAEGLPCLPEGLFSEPVAAFWPYFDRDFNLLCFIVRLKRPDGGKKFSWLTYQRDRETGACSWQKLGLPQPWPLYGLEFLAQGPDKILIVEGEKCAEAGRRLFPDWCVITWPGGGKSPQHADWSPVRAATSARVVLWPDNDIPGQSTMSRVAEILARPAQIVSVNPTWAKGYDLADLEHDSPSDAAKYLESHVQSVVVISSAERPEVILSGDPYKDSDAIYDGIKETEADIFYADGPVYVRTNIHGHTDVHPFTARTFSAWAARRLDLKKYSTRGTIPCQVPEPMSEIVLFHAQEHLPHLHFFSDMPVFSGDGELLEKQGYNQKAKAFINLPRGYENHMPIEEAWNLLDDLLADFPFESPSDRTAALCYPVTAIVRHCVVGPTPLFRFEAPVPGTGKTLLCTTLTEIITPHVEFFPLPEFDEELQKALTAILMGVPAVTVFDNVDKLEGHSLEQALTEMVWGKRKLGTNELCHAPIHTVWAATLNNPVIKPSMFRRTVRIRLNAGVENPEKRPAIWRHPQIVDYVRQNRAKLVAAFVAMAALGIDQEASPTLPRMGSFESWSRRVGAIAEVNGLSDFLKTIEEDRKLTADPSVEAVRELVERWADTYAGTSIQASDLVKLATGIDNLPVKYIEGRPSSKSLGWVLAKMRGAVIAGCEISSSSGNSNGRFYKLVGKQRTLQDQKPSMEF